MGLLVNQPRFVLGVDPLLSGVSIARFVEGDSTPAALFIPGPGLPEGDRSLVAQVARIDAIAAAVMGATLKRGVPTLVALSAPSVGRHDSSGPRRSALVGEIGRRLVAAGVPAVEIETMLLTRWLVGRQQRKGFDRVTEEIKQNWHPERWQPENGPGWEEAVEAGFRPTTVAMAAAAAALAGIGTRRPVRNADLAVLGELRSQLPVGWELPVNETFWPAGCGPQAEEASREKEAV